MLAVAAGFEGILDLARGDALRPTFIVLRRVDAPLGGARSGRRRSERRCDLDQNRVTGFCYVEHMSTPLRVFAPSSIRHPTRRGQAWWTDYLGFPPYFDEPFYVGFEVAGYELGLVPTDQTGASPRPTGASTTWPSRRRR